MVAGMTEGRFIDDLLRLMAAKGASDLHFKVPSPPILRLDGRLVAVEGAPPMNGEAIRAAFEHITNEEQRQLFYRERELDAAYSISGLARFRVNAFWQRGTIALSIRMVPLQVATIDDLGLPQVCKSLALRPRGLILVTGPSGSGKSTTLAAMIDHLNENEAAHVITIEDPIEFLYRDKRCVIAQRELGTDSRGFAESLRHVLRQDPDVILVGEMRDLETTEAALRAAETGHLVLSTLHTTSAAQTVERIIDIFPANQQSQVRAQLALTLEGVLCQQLLPRAAGRGRVAAVEVMAVTPGIRNLIREGKTHQVPGMIQIGAQQGMQTLDQALSMLVRQGLITLEDAIMRCQNPDDLRRLVQGQG